MNFPPIIVPFGSQLVNVFTKYIFFLALFYDGFIECSNEMCSNYISFFSHNVIVDLLIMMDLLWIENVQIITFKKFMDF